MKLFKRKKPMYRVIKDRELNGLTIDVNALIKLGWKLQGGICVVQTKTGGNQYDYTTIDYYYQAMTY